jgi:hypothetical protein
MRDLPGALPRILRQRRLAAVDQPVDYGTGVKEIDQ